MKYSLFKKSTLVLGTVVAVAGCGGDTHRAPLVADEQLENIIAERSLTGDPSTGRTLPNIESPLAQLGMQLFFTKGLGGDQDSACVTCHHPTLGGGDDLSLPIGVEAETADLLGPGRTHSSSGTHYDGGPTVPRNAPTTFNMSLWDQFIFHDGRVESLTKTAGENGANGGIRTPDSAFGVADANAGANLTVAQARFPVTSPEEMRGFTFEAGNSNDDVRSHLEDRLQGIGGELATNNWLAAFRTGLSNATGAAADLITYANIANAIAEYERSQTFVDTPWKDYVEGNTDALTDDQKAGAILFFTSVAAGGAGCASCHSGDFFSDEQFHVVAVPQIGRGKGNGATTTDDFGRFRETGVENDRYAFRTPSLLNVTETGPWGHAGAHTTLEGIVRYHLDPTQAYANYDVNQLESSVQVGDMDVNTQAALAQLELLQASGDSLLVDTTLSDTNVMELVAFLSALTDPCVTTSGCIGQWVPSGTDENPDDLRVNAVNESGDPL